MADVGGPNGRGEGEAVGIFGGEIGIQLPRVSAVQLQTGREIEPRVSALHPGDILGFYGEPGGKGTHVGLYIGDGEFIHSSSIGVTVSRLDSPYWREHFFEARRVVW